MSRLGKTFGLLIVIIFLISLVMLPPAAVKAASPRRIVVPDDYSTIQAAINQANDGDTVFVKDGVYNPAGLFYDVMNDAGSPYVEILVNRSISLIGEDSQKTIIMGKTNNGYSGPQATIRVTADDVTISGFTILGSASNNAAASDGEKGIEVAGTYDHAPSHCSIIGNIIKNNFFDGIATSGYYNQVTGVTKPSYDIIANNTVTGNAGYGMYISSSSTVISGNQISGNILDGIIIDSCVNVTISGNNISRNGQTDYWLPGGLCLRWLGPFYVYNNNITNNIGNGVIFGENCGNSIITANNIANNTIGINLGPVFSQDSVGSGSTIYKNNIINNRLQVAVNQTSDKVAWDNGAAGNYWSDYQGQGTYRIDGNNIDHHPLTQQIDVNAQPSITSPLSSSSPSPAIPILAPTSTNPTTNPSGRKLVVPDNYPTIQAAINNASAGDTVYVKRGIYYSLGYAGVLVNKSISLIGENSQQTILRPSGFYRYFWQSLIQVTADNVKISGFTIDGAVYNVTWEDMTNDVPLGISGNAIVYSKCDDVENGILVGNSYDNEQIVSNCHIFGNNIIHCVFSGASLSGQYHSVNQNNITDNSGPGISTSSYVNTLTRVANASYDEIFDNYVARNDNGMSISSSSTAVYDNQIIDNHQEGIWVSSCLNVTIAGNNISNNGKNNQTSGNGGLSLGNWGPFYVYGNNIFNNSEGGVSFEDYCNDALVHSNNITGNEIGLETYNVRDIGQGNIVYQNNIVDNKQQVAMNVTLYVAEGDSADIVAFDNGIVGNYWSDYLTKYPGAVITGSSGIGNTPYVIDQNNIDHYPLIHQVDISATAVISTPSFATDTSTSTLTIPIIVTVVLVVLVLGSLLLYRRHRKTSQKTLPFSKQV
ncbi:MAG: NosD domain-containing protein [Candidatus Bathyarchaeia archaeon]